MNCQSMKCLQCELLSSRWTKRCYDNLLQSFIIWFQLFHFNLIFFYCFFSIPFSCFFSTEDHISTHHCFISEWVIEFVSFRLLIVAHEDTLCSTIIQLLSFSLRYLCICNTPNIPQVCHTWFVPSACLLGSHVPNTFCKAQVEQVGYACNCFCLELLWEAIFIEHGPHL